MLLDEFADRIDDRAFMTDYFRRHTEAVKRAIAPERLLVYQAGDGWEPLCAFLQTPVPESPYPMVNSRQEFASHVRSAGGDPTKLGQDFSSRPRA
jgi:hypothetical protein